MLSAVRREDPERLRRLVGRHMAERRRALGLTQEQLAVEMGISAQYVSMVERGAQNLAIDSLARFANALGVPVRDLFEPVARIEPPRKGRPPRAT